MWISDRDFSRLIERVEKLEKRMEDTVISVDYSEYDKYRIVSGINQYAYQYQYPINKVIAGIAKSIGLIYSKTPEIEQFKIEK